ncbi:MAG: serine protease [Richelia sp. SL_2_1]|nr:serine protease [Richelia sp. SL_2_1]
MNKNIAIITSILLFQFPTFAITLTTKAQTAPQNSTCEIIPEKVKDDYLEYSEKQLETIANRITVKVIGDNNGGSGTLLAKKGNTYLVLTNSHVVRGINSINLKTVDGKTHTAQIIPNTKFEKFDLALLQFQTNEIYCPTDVANFLPDTTMSVTAGGFSGEKGEMIFSHGKIQQISQPLKEGYQIGYTSNIEQGMSGGAIIHSSGILVGINGRGAYPILNSGYVYQNGSRPSESEIQEMRKLSWGIPISTVLAEVNADILTAYSLPLPETTASVPEPQLTGWLGDLEQKAKEFTVRIDSSSKDINGINNNGSGVIIAKEKNGNIYTYTVLTAAHVVCERNNVKQPCGNFSYTILAFDGNKYPVDKSTIKREEGVDLGVVKFVSEQNYEVATLANYNPSNRQYMFTAGYPKLGNNSPWRFTAGRIFEKESGFIRVRQSDFQNNSSSQLRTASFLTGGYELVYSSITDGGMSGGPVLDSDGRVIGIHGRAEGEEVIDKKTGNSGSDKTKVQLGYSLGIPINTFLDLMARLDAKPAKVEENLQSPQLDKQKIESIQKSILSSDVLKGNAHASTWLERGNQFWRLERYSDAVKAFDQVINLQSDLAYLAYYGKGLALFEDEKYQEAVDALEKTVKLKSDFVAALQILSIVYGQLNQPDKALIAINKAIQQQPKKPTLLIFRVLSYIQQKKFDLALADINTVLDINPKIFILYIYRGFIYNTQKNGIWHTMISIQPLISTLKVFILTCYNLEYIKARKNGI